MAHFMFRDTASLRVELLDGRTDQAALQRDPPHRLEVDTASVVAAGEHDPPSAPRYLDGDATGRRLAFAT